MRRGFTLLELLITLTASMVIFGLLISFYLGYFRIWQYELQKQNLNQQFCAASEKIASNLQSTGRIDISDLPFENIRIESEGNNLHKIIIDAQLGKQTYTYEHYFQGSL